MAGESFALYHWSPTDRRARINRYGFRPSMLDRTGSWRPPYVCFSDDPWLAWQLSGKLDPEIPSWDLWLTWSDVPSGMEAIYDHMRDTHEEYVKEYRIYERIYKRDVWYVATRTT